MSTMAIAPLLGIDGPLPEAPAHNIFTVALPINRDDGAGIQFRAQADDARPLAGVVVVPDPVGPPFLWEVCSEGTMRVKESEPRDLPDGRIDADDRTFLPFLAYVVDQCQSRGIGEWERWKDRVNRVYLAVEAWAAERQLAAGSAEPDNPYFLDSNGVTLGSGAVGPVEGLALLENAIAGTARKGVIHATPATATMWAANRLLLWNRDQAVTVATRTPVVVGYGYVGIGGTSGDQEYAFASGPIGVERGDFFENAESIADTLDRSVNDVVYRAERDMLVVWDTALQANVLIDRSQTP